MIGLVYFLQSVEGPVKIGWSNNIERRIKDLATPRGIGVLLASIEGGFDLEAHFHDLVSQHRIHREWFEPMPPVLGLAAAVADKRFTPPAGLKGSDRVLHLNRIRLAAAIEANKDEARNLIRVVAGTHELGGRNRDFFARVEALTGLSVPRIERIWHREARQILAAEMDILRLAASDLTEAPPRPG